MKKALGDANTARWL